MESIRALVSDLGLLPAFMATSDELQNDEAVMRSVMAAAAAGLSAVPPQELLSLDPAKSVAGASRALMAATRAGQGLEALDLTDAENEVLAGLAWRVTTAVAARSQGRLSALAK